MLDKEKREPAEQGDLQAANCVGGVQSRDQPGQGIIHEDRSNNRDYIGDNTVRLFDVGHGLGVIIQPQVAKQCVPSKADQLMKNHENPNGEMVDASGHRMVPILLAI